MVLHKTSVKGKALTSVLTSTQKSMFLIRFIYFWASSTKIL